LPRRYSCRRKRWRGIWGILIAKFLGIKVEEEGDNQKLLMDILSCIEILHQSSVVIDDAADGSKMRRGIPCIHHQYGYSVGIMAGVNLLLHPLRQFVRYRPNESALFMKHILDEQGMLYIGQSADAAFRFDNIIPEEQNYYEISLCKAGLYTRLIVKFLFDSFSKNEKLKNQMIKLNDRMFLIH
jgi:geranylgeranyl pyrophosphate synthase